MARVLPVACDWVEQRILEGHATLVHCANGSNRSATVCVAMVMKLKELTLAQAFAAVLHSRSNIFPLKDNQEALICWERKIYGTVSMRVEDFATLKRTVRSGKRRAAAESSNAHPTQAGGETKSESKVS